MFANSGEPGELVGLAGFLGSHIAERAERAAILQAAIHALPERQRMALILSRFEGQSYEEVASVLDCSRKSVESLLVRAKKTLAKSFSK